MFTLKFLLWGWLCLFMLSSTAHAGGFKAKLAPRCQDEIAKAVEERSKDAPELPAIPPLRLGREVTLPMFEAAVTAWRKSFDVSELQKQFILAARQGNKDLPEKYLHKIKKVRRRGTLLRSTYLLFSAGHSAPEMLRTFLRDFGRFNDLIAFGHSADVKKQALVVLENLPSPELDEILPELEPAEPEAIEDYFRASAASITESLEKTKLKVSEFHEARKGVRDIRNTLRALKKVERRENNWKAAEEYFTYLNLLLGDINDRLFQQFLAERDPDKDLFEERKKFENKVKVEVPAKVREHVLAGLERFVGALTHH